MLKIALCCSFAVALAASSSALAQTEDVAGQGQAAGSSAAELSSPRPGVTAPDPTTQPPQPTYLDYPPTAEQHAPRPHPVGSVLAEFGLGSLGLVMGTTITIGVIVAGYDSSSDTTLTMGILFGPALTFALMQAGIYGAGRATGGRGTFWWTTLGLASGLGAGALLGFGLIGALTRHRYGGISDTGALAGTLLTPALGLLGGILGFELSDRKGRSQVPSGLEITPVLSPLRGGLSLGLTGRF
ncbi:MAG: hypothetical protein GXP55_07325 [Deltaproteobacteria bacterium]|nr:hypothetical protein [Deltaproteobacteria bacterium]